MMCKLASAALCALSVLSGCSGVEVLYDVSYDDRFGDAARMDVYLPSDGGSNRGAVLAIHGGAWKSGSKENFASDSRRLAGAGYVVASINYRLIPDGSYPRLMQDAECALSFFRAMADEWGLDPDRVATLGYSAGGHIASLLGVATDEPDFEPDCAAGGTFAPRAVISGAGPQDLREMASADAVRDLVGGSLSEVPEQYDRASPITHVNGDAPPFLFIHGSHDLIVSIDQSREMRAALRAAGVEADLLTIPGGGHVLNNGADFGQVELLTSTNTPEAWAAAISFLDRTVGASP